ncbi:nucleoside hydrolase [Martelella alba]|uniref:Nucleoside hydrolase n=1 Tax=Martelella alba TaxID=2590451 RepID=A0A506UD15_9HYPH|nr:nucleoside hydrolase [Martelella alba]TPW31021.1 nucleoside hydrolase [Martelella alba]
MGIWIDTDMGFDDLAAVLTVRASGLDIDGLSLVFGNAPLAQVRANAAAAAQAFSFRFPVHAGADRAILGAVETAETILGKTGMPSTGRQLEPAPEAFSGPALDGLSRWLETAESPRRVLALGPLTNIAILCLARPDLAAKIDELVWMGGGATMGNHTASAEFNALADPEAVAIVLTRGLPLKMADLDFCRKVTIGAEDVAAIRAKSGANAAVLGDLSEGFLDIARSRGRSRMAFFDPAAAAALARPALVTVQKVRIDVELAGHLTRGRTVVENRPHKAAPNAELLVGIDEQAAHSLIMAALLAEAAP